MAKLRNWDKSRTYRFELTGSGKNHKGRYIIPTESTVYDDEVGYREVRLSPTEASPFVDEQRENARASNQTIIFHKGRLSVSGRETYKLNYLMALDHNADKKNAKAKSIYKYRLIDEEKLFKDLANLKKLRIKAQSQLLNATKEELSDWLKAEYNFTPKVNTVDELLNKALAYAEKDPEHVIRTFNSEDSRMKARLIQAFKTKTLVNNKGKVSWGDTGTEIKVFKLTADNKLTDQMVDWISKGTEDALEFVKKFATYDK